MYARRFARLLETHKCISNLCPHFTYDSISLASVALDKGAFG